MNDDETNSALDSLKMKSNQLENASEYNEIKIKNIQREIGEFDNKSSKLMQIINEVEEKSGCMNGKAEISAVVQNKIQDEIEKLTDDISREYCVYDMNELQNEMEKLNEEKTSLEREISILEEMEIEEDQTSYDILPIIENTQQYENQIHIKFINQDSNLFKSQRTFHEYSKKFGLDRSQCSSALNSIEKNLMQAYSKEKEICSTQKRFLNKFKRKLEEKGKTYTEELKNNDNIKEFQSIETLSIPSESQNETLENESILYAVSEFKEFYNNSINENEEDNLYFDIKKRFDFPSYKPPLKQELIYDIESDEKNIQICKKINKIKDNMSNINQTIKKSVNINETINNNDLQMNEIETILIPSEVTDIYNKNITFNNFKNILNEELSITIPESNIFFSNTEEEENYEYNLDESIKDNNKERENKLNQIIQFVNDIKEPSIQQIILPTKINKRIIDVHTDDIIDSIQQIINTNEFNKDNLINEINELTVKQEEIQNKCINEERKNNTNEIKELKKKNKELQDQLKDEIQKYNLTKKNNDIDALVKNHKDVEEERNSLNSEYQNYEIYTEEYLSELTQEYQKLKKKYQNMKLEWEEEQELLNKLKKTVS